MKIKPRTKGCNLLLEKLQKIDKDQKLDEEDIDEILDNEDLKRWLKAYEGVGEVQDRFKKILRSLHKEQPSDLNQWEKKIDYGLRKAVDNPENMRSAVKEIQNIDWQSVVRSALRYLPDGTEVDPDFIITIDGFNGGMFIKDTVFLSLVYFDRSMFQEDTFAHEFHHMGAEYWFNRNRLIKKYGKKKKDDIFYMMNLFKYLVGEGLANAFCSPRAVTKTISDSEESDQYNKMIENYEENIEGLFVQLEELIENILSDSERNLSEAYSEFTMDKRGMGLPPGHFLSGRMVLTMKNSQKVDEEEIIELVKDPFSFFELYNRAAEDIDKQKISPDTVKELDLFLEDLRDRK